MLEGIEYLEIKKRKYPITFSINVMEKLQEEYGSIKVWNKKLLGDKEIKKLDKKGKEITEVENTGEPNLKAMKFCLTEMINEGIDIENEKNNEKTDFVTLKQVGRIITEIGIEKTTEKIFDLINKSYDTGEEEKN